MPLTTDDLKEIAAALREVSSSSTSSAMSSTSAVSIKLPPFWQDEPTLWFSQVESMFSTKGITQDKTKYDYIVSALDNKAALEIKPTIVKPPTEKMYDTIKSVLIAAFDKPQEAKDAELLSLTDIGDRTPSSHYRYLQALNSDGTTLLRALFLSHLPADVRTIVQAQGITDNLELAKAADRAMQARDSSRHPPSAAAVRTRQQRNQRSNRSSSNRDREGTSEYTCYFHKRFGKSARRCQPDCRFNEQFNTTAANLVSEQAGNDQTDRV